jgi:hypothetical protein
MYRTLGNGSSSLHPGYSHLHRTTKTHKTRIITRSGAQHHNDSNDDTTLHNQTYSCSFSFSFLPIMSTETIDDVYVRIFSAVMLKSYGKSPHDHQLQVAVPLMHMLKRTNAMYPSSFFCIQPTGKGKSLVRDTIARIICGVTITISPLLSLSADQVKKILDMTKTSNDKAFKVYHLDELTVPSQQKAFTEMLLGLCGNKNTRVAISLFVSPQAVKRDKWIQQLLDSLIEASLLRMVCLDEIHIFLEHALNFRDEFSDLKSFLFQKLHVKNGKPNELLVPILSIMATADKNLVEVAYPRVTGMTVPKFDSFVSWPTPNQMQRRNVFLHFEYKEQTKHIFKTYVTEN